MLRVAAILGLISAGTAWADVRRSTPEIIPSELPKIMEAVRKPGAQAVLLNVWATWCDPCVEEMPDILRFYRDHRDRGLRLILVSADDIDEKAGVEKFLASKGVDFPSFLKQGDDMEFVNGLERKWRGNLPASFLYDGRGGKRHFWPGTVTYAVLEKKVGEVLAEKKKDTKARRRP